MRTRFLRAFRLASLFLLVGCSRTLTEAEMLVAAKDLDQRHLEAFNKRDVDAFMALHWKSPDLQVLDANEFFTGWDAWKANIGPYFQKQRSLEFKLTKVKNKVIGDLVFGQQEWSGENIDVKGIRRSSAGMTSNVKALRDGKWVIISVNHVILDPISPKPDEMLKAAATIDSRSSEAFNLKEVDTFMANYLNSPNLVVVDVGELAVGYEQWKSKIAGQLAAKDGGRFQITESHNIPQGENVLGWGRWSFTPANTKARPAFGFYTNVKALRDGKWVVVMDHYSLERKKR